VEIYVFTFVERLGGWREVFGGAGELERLWVWAEFG
jgi:hypothetical protein